MTFLEMKLSEAAPCCVALSGSLLLCEPDLLADLRVSHPQDDTGWDISIGNVGVSC